MSEEVKNAGKAVPRTMLYIYILNFVLLFPAIITIVYHCPDLDAALNDSTTYPAIYVMRQSMSNAWVSVILAIMALICCASCINYFAAVTRDLFAFARDFGVPFSGWISAVHPRRHLPVNASILSAVFASLLSLIYIGSPVAFYAITSLSTVSLLSCYTLSIGSVLWRRIYKPETLPPAQFSLGHRFGIVMNSCAVIFGIWSLFWSFWPQSVPVTAPGFNWASVIFSIVIIFSLIYYVFIARHRYAGPVTEVEGRKSDFQ
jgi:choline transport protein